MFSYYLESGVLQLHVFFLKLSRSGFLKTTTVEVTTMHASAGGTPGSTLEDKKLVKFVELLVHDYLQAKGFEETGVKFAEECSNAGGGRGRSSDGSSLDEADSWYYLADKLSLPVRTSSIKHAV